MNVPQGTHQYQGETFESPRLRAQRVLASELDPALPAIAIGDWIRTTVQTDREMQWTTTGCPATQEEVDALATKRSVCVLATASLLARPGPERPQAAAKGELVVPLSIRLGTGNPNAGAWHLERPQVEDAFIERDGDSLSVPRLGDLPHVLGVSPERWPKSDLSVSPSDIRCDKALPKPAESVRCEVTIHNRGPVEAVVRILPSVVEVGNDIAAGKSIPRYKIPPNDQVVVAWDWVWPQGRAWSLDVSVELLTPHAYGGYRIPIKERNVQNNRASVMVRARN
jgi:hypothetical protein